MHLALERVSKVVASQTHLLPLDLTLQPGAVNVVLGATLAGKTTLLRLMAGLDRPPDCIVSADIDRVWIERTEDQQVLAEWTV